MGNQAERTHSKAAAGGPSEVADCGAGLAKLQLALRQQQEKLPASQERWLERLTRA